MPCDIDPNNVSALCPNKTSSTLGELLLDWASVGSHFKMSTLSGPHAAISPVTSRLTSALESLGATGFCHHSRVAT